MTTHDARPPLTDLGTIRRVRALHALGWGPAHLAAHTTLNRRILAALANGHREHATPDVAGLIDQLYEHLSMTIGPSPRTRDRARANRWAPPLAWDDDRIDSPTGRPNYGREPETGIDVVEQSCIDDVLDGRAPLNYLPKACRTRLVADLCDAGKTREQIAARLRTELPTVDRHLTKLRATSGRHEAGEAA